MNATPELCWYCNLRPAVVWCDHRLGSSLGDPVQVQLALGEVAPSPPLVVETCDAAACGACRARRGWKLVLSALVCVRGRGRHGGQRITVDRCHVHAEAGAGSDTWIGAAGVAMARSDVRAACRLAGGAS